MTKEQETISKRNQIIARKLLGLVGKPNLVLHHIDPSWRHNDIERYIQWNLEDLEIMDRGAHASLHQKGTKKPRTEEWNRKLGLAHKGLKNPAVSESNRRRTGWHQSEDAKIRMSESKKGHKGAALGKHWYNNGIIQTYAFECPEGFKKGRLK